MEQRTDRRSHKPPENIEEGHVWKSEIRLVENKSLGWIEARRRAETVINNCDASIRRITKSKKLSEIIFVGCFVGGIALWLVISASSQSQSSIPNFTEAQ